MSRSIKSEIDRRTTDASKLAALEARNTAILEMVAGQLQEVIDLLKSEGFAAPAVVQPPRPVSIPPVNATVIQEAQLAAAPAPQIKNPCAVCGQEAMGTESLPDGSKKFLCRPHYQARLAQKQEEETTKQLLGSEGTLYTRPQQPQAPVKKILIQHSDPLLGNGAPAPPANNILADSDD